MRRAEIQKAVRVRVSAEKFDEKPHGAVENDIECKDGSRDDEAFSQKPDDEKAQKKRDRFIKLCRVDRMGYIREFYSEGGSGYDAVATSGEKTADPTDTVRKKQ